MSTTMVPIDQVEAFFNRIGDLLEQSYAEMIKAENHTATVRSTRPEQAPKKAKAERKCPSDAAKNFKVGDSMVGNDGFIWVVSQRPKSGAFYWKKVMIDEGVAIEDQKTINAERFIENTATEPKKRGRPAKKVEGEKTEPLKRGRPAKKVEGEKSGPKKVEGEKAEPKKRGRPAKKVEGEKTEPKKRGRPAKKIEGEKVEGEKKPKAPRKCPKQKAKDAGLGTSTKGVDGNIWTVMARPNSGHLYWKKM